MGNEDLGEAAGSKFGCAIHDGVVSSVYTEAYDMLWRRGKKTNKKGAVSSRFAGLKFVNKTP